MCVKDAALCIMLQWHMRRVLHPIVHEHQGWSTSWRLVARRVRRKFALAGMILRRRHHRRRQLTSRAQRVPLLDVDHDVTAICRQAVRLQPRVRVVMQRRVGLVQLPLPVHLVHELVGQPLDHCCVEALEAALRFRIRLVQMAPLWARRNSVAIPLRHLSRNVTFCESDDAVGLPREVWRR